MTRALDLARRHAETCNAAETCAPTVSAPYLAAAIERCRLPIRVINDDIGFMVAHQLLPEHLPEPNALYAIWHEGPDPAEATRTYLALCDSLSPAPSSRHDACPGAETATGPSPTLEPVASSFESAGAPGQGASPPAGAVSSDAVAGALPPRASAEIPGAA